MKAEFEILKGKILFTRWHEGKMSLSEVKVVMEHLLALLKRENLKLYIDDISKCEVDWEEADLWIVNDWYPRALEHGVTKNALIVCPGVVMQHKDEQCEIKSFTNFHHALRWIYPSLFRRYWSFLSKS